MLNAQLFSRRFTPGIEAYLDAKMLSHSWIKSSTPT
jgi:hypothetical protein